jgi:hypothetical protein
MQLLVQKFSLLIPRQERPVWQSFVVTQVEPMGLLPGKEPDSHTPLLQTRPLSHWLLSVQAPQLPPIQTWPVLQSLLIEHSGVTGVSHTPLLHTSPLLHSESYMQAPQRPDQQPRPAAH